MRMIGKVTTLYIGLNALIMLALAILVVRQRARTRTGIGDGNHPDMARAIRVHGNNTEYVPICLLLLAGLEAVQWPLWLLHTTGLALTVGRISHAVGLSQSSGESK